MSTQFKQFKEEKVLLEDLETQNLIEEVLAEQEWSKAMNANELFEELGLGSV